MPVLADRVQETTTTTGTGTLTLAGAVTGFQSFTTASLDGKAVDYTIVNASGSEWEVGRGTFTASGTTLSRTTVFASSNSNAAVNFSAGTKNVFVTMAAESYADFGDGSGNSNSISGDDPHWVNITNNPSSGAGRQLFRINSYGASGYGGNVHFCRYRGTVAAPSAVQSGDFFQSFGYRGWDSGGALSQSAAAFQVLATENWTSTAHGIKFRWEVTPNGSTTRALGMELLSTGLDVTGDITAAGKIKNTESIIVACSDEGTALTAGTGKVTFRMPYAFTVTAVRASLTTAQTSGSIFTVDINEGGTTILSTKLTIDNTEKTSTTAATAAVISDSALADDAEITVDIDQIGDGTAKGLKIVLIGKKA